MNALDKRTPKTQKRENGTPGRGADGNNAEGFYGNYEEMNFVSERAIERLEEMKDKVQSLMVDQDPPAPYLIFEPCPANHLVASTYTAFCAFCRSLGFVSCRSAVSRAQLRGVGYRPSGLPKSRRYVVMVCRSFSDAARCRGYALANLATKSLPGEHTGEEVQQPVGSTRVRRFWTEEETNALLSGYERYKNEQKKWSQIKADPEFCDILARRSGVDLKDRFRVLRIDM